MTETPSVDAPDSNQTLGEMVKRLGPAAILAGLWAVLPAVMGIVLIKNRKEAAEFLMSLTNSENSDSMSIMTVAVIFVGFFALTSGIGVLPTYASALFAGYLLGIAIGFPSAILGITAGATIGYAIALIVARRRVEGEIHRHPKAEIIRDAFVKHGFWRALGILILLRVSPSSPFSLMNGLMAVSGVRVVPYVLATAIGMAPRTFAAVWIGSQITSWDEKPDKPTWMFITGIVLTVVVVVIIGQLANKALESALGKHDSDTDQSTDNEQS